MMRTQHDCIENARQRLAALGVEDEQFKTIDDEVKAIIQDAADFAQASPEPDPVGALDRCAVGGLNDGDPDPDARAEPTMTEGKLARWLKHVGDEVRAGDVIAEIETDKATMEVEAVDEGKLAQILVDEGTEGVAVNTPIAVLSQQR